ncbi:MAG TPA: C-GCAxxG-C-C family protein [Thermosynergistes sp.]|nr:C-GCAxxG-C-C family protein [Thermosynergistes sp.]
MNLSELTNKVQELAYQYERQYGGCTQCVVGAYKTALRTISDDVFKAATGLAGGIGLTGSACGALTGGAIVISTFIGRDFDNFADPSGERRKTFKLVAKLVDRFKEEYGSTICRDIQTKLMGRPFNLRDKEDYKEFLAAGGHEDKCPSVCANTVKWIAEILADEGLLKGD